MSKKSVRHPVSRPSAALEQLEDRRLLSATGTAFIRGDVLHIRGTKGDDLIGVSTALGTSTMVTVNEQRFNFDPTSWRRLIVSTYGGNDEVLAVMANAPTKSFGNVVHRFNLGTGNDKLTGTVGRDIVDLGAGNDVFYGTDGADKVSAGAGRDEVTVTAQAKVSRAESVVRAAASDPYAYLNEVFDGTRSTGSTTNDPKSDSKAGNSNTAIGNVNPFDWWSATTGEGKYTLTDRTSALDSLATLASLYDQGKVADWFATFGVVYTGQSTISLALQAKPGSYALVNELSASLGFDTHSEVRRESIEAEIVRHDAAADFETNPLSFVGTIPIQNIHLLVASADLFARIDVNPYPSAPVTPISEGSN